MATYRKSSGGPKNSLLSSETEYWNPSVCFVLSQRKNEPQHHTGCLDTFGRPRGESPEKKQSLGVTFRGPQRVPLCVNNSHNQRVWQLQSILEIIPNHSTYRSGNREQRVEMTSLSKLINRGVGWCTWRALQDPRPEPSASIPPVTAASLPEPESEWELWWDCGYIFFCGDKHFLITI